jgi:hypothetical protein
MGRIVLIFALLAAPAAADRVVIDRTAVAVGTEVITESEILEEIRLVAFLNGQPLDFSPEARRRAAERLVDQYLIRREMRLAMYAEPDLAEAEAMLRNLRLARFPTEADYRAALERYGITEAQLLRHLHWQLTAMRFTDLRFRLGLPEPDEDLLHRLEREAEVRAERIAPGAPAIDPPVSAPGVDEQLEDWLREARQRTRIVFMREAFQ